MTGGDVAIMRSGDSWNWRLVAALTRRYINGRPFQVPPAARGANKKQDILDSCLTAASTFMTIPMI